MTDQICPTCTTPVSRGTAICPVCATALPAVAAPTQVLPTVYPPPPPVTYSPPGVYAAPSQVVVVGSSKDPALAAVLGFFFGPLGLLYSTVPGAAIMFGVSVVVGLLTFGLGLFLLWPVSAVVGFRAAKSSNQRLAYAATGYGYYPPRWPTHRQSPTRPAGTQTHMDRPPPGTGTAPPGPGTPTNHQRSDTPPRLNAAHALLLTSGVRAPRRLCSR
jgi:hypothetical protein